MKAFELKIACFPLGNTGGLTIPRTDSPDWLEDAIEV